ncbi:hypothetical protein R69746_01576 [Paraburkholderia aspalathi]|nr:hypothetical protein R69746_01576 [Paraburkholderia aspalathi]
MRGAAVPHGRILAPWLCAASGFAVFCMDVERSGGARCLPDAFYIRFVASDVDDFSDRRNRIHGLLDLDYPRDDGVGIRLAIAQLDAISVAYIVRSWTPDAPFSPSFLRSL